MQLISFTVALIRDAFVEALKGMQRTAFAALLLIAFWIASFFAMLALGGIGIVGGIVLFWITAWLTGTYLSMVEVGVLGQRVLGPGDLRNHAGQHFNTVMNVMFLFWVPQFLLGMSSPTALHVAVPVAAVVFNPIPEMIYQERHERGVDVVWEAFGFMQRNWPEWLAGQALVATPFVLAWSALLGGYWLDAATLVFGTFGPFFGFVSGGAGVIVLGPFAAVSLLLAPVVHLTMLFRGQLYKRLRLSNRRQRAWQSRF